MKNWINIFIAFMGAGGLTVVTWVGTHAKEWMREAVDDRISEVFTHNMAEHLHVEPKQVDPTLDAYVTKFDTISKEYDIVKPILIEEVKHWKVGFYVSKLTGQIFRRHYDGGWYLCREKEINNRIWFDFIDKQGKYHLVQGE